jgi:hypothetical protein
MLGDIAAFMVALVSFVEFHIGGTLFATDVLLVVVFLYLAAKRGNKLFSPWPQKVVLFAVLWLISQIGTDIVRQSSPEDYLRGWGNILFFITNFAALYLLLRTDRRICLYATGFALSMTIKYFVNPDPMVAEDPWKWGLAWPVTLSFALISTVAYSRRKTVIALVVLALASLLNLHYNYRSMALFSFATLCCLLLGLRKNNSQQSPFKLAVMVLCLAACGWGFQKLYEYEASSGALGQDALEKYKAQSAGKLGLVIGGRSESLVSIQAVMDSPIIGHGSWARDAHYVALYQDARVANGYKITPAKNDLIPAHSHILGAWVDAGVLGAVFWFVTLLLTLQGMQYLLVYPLPLRVLSVFCGFSLLWDIPFSAFGSGRRFITPVYVILMIVAIGRGRKQRGHEALERYRVRQMKAAGSGSPKMVAVGTSYNENRHSNAVI